MQRTVLRAILIFTLVFSSALGLTQSRSVSDQVIINTQRLYDLERRMSQIEQGGSELAGQTAARTTINDIKIDALAKEIHDIRSVLTGVAIFVLTHVFGFIIYLLKNRVALPPRRNARD